ncbi:MAG: hypothetical protein MZU95_07660 [Desulfomicrobium escambiense]|nr:hypothetical protein [Desulfomicrobium escambiense]
MSSPAASCPAGDIRRACTRRSRQRKTVKIEHENQTLATITFQNYFRMYRKLAGHRHRCNRGRRIQARSTVAAAIQLWTHRPTMIRQDYPDTGSSGPGARSSTPWRTRWRNRFEKGQPSSLWGRPRLENSEMVSRLLKARKISPPGSCTRSTTREAKIVSQAGRLNAVTVATNMAGRGDRRPPRRKPEPLAREVPREKELEESIGCRSLCGDPGKGTHGMRNRR